MPRKQSAVLDYKLRIKESLRRKIEASAKQRGVSLNYEMARRLEQSFVQGPLDEAAFKIHMMSQDMETRWAQFGEFFHKIAGQNGLGSAAEALAVAVEALPPECQSEDVRAAVAALRTRLTVMDHERAIALRKVEP
jgi:hypothetical protein